ncbi:MAG: glycosyltransferase [Lacunisphaera sp.]
MRILHVIFSSRIAGAERYCIDLANRQAEMGFDVHVAGKNSSPIAGALNAEVKFHGTNVLFFRSRRLHRLITNLGVDICHAHLGPACKALSKDANNEIKVATLHVGYKPHQHARLDGVICVNHAQADRLAGYRGKVRVISNWMPQAPMGISGPGLRAKLRLSSDVFLILAVGRLHPSKGMDLLISAFLAVGPDRAVLVILGEGPARSKLEKLKAGDTRIHLLGFMDNVQDCLRDADLFISPSREESFGLAILEAMAVGIPIIATSAEGPREFLRDQPAELVQPDSVEALGTALRGAYARFRSNQLGRVHYDLLPFAPATAIDCIAGFYREMIKANTESEKIPPLATIP